MNYTYELWPVNSNQEKEKKGEKNPKANVPHYSKHSIY